jgi:hypothetical protein
LNWIYFDGLSLQHLLGWMNEVKRWYLEMKKFLASLYFVIALT